MKSKVKYEKTDSSTDPWLLQRGVGEELGEKSAVVKPVT